MRQTEWSDPTAGLADGHVDAALLRLPFPGQDAFHVEPLLTEPRWVALPATPRLAHHTQIAFHDLWDEPFVATPPDSGWWRDYWLATDERDGHPARIGAIAQNPDEWLTAIANGYGVSLCRHQAWCGGGRRVLHPARQGRIPGRPAVPGDQRRVRRRHPPRLDHRGVGQVDTRWALVWHFNADGKVDRVVNLSGDQHQMDAFVWSNYPLAPIPARLA
jgi:DNA-binding transcriptional LysR family regulator